jgi:hypothetical protein
LDPFKGVSCRSTEDPKAIGAITCESGEGQRGDGYLFVVLRPFI